MASAARAGGGVSFAAQSTKAGYLMKRSPLKVWQKRWFVLEANELAYFRSYDQYMRQKDDEYTHPVPCCGRVKKRGSKQAAKAEVHNLVAAGAGAAREHAENVADDACQAAAVAQSDVTAEDVAAAARSALYGALKQSTEPVATRE